jgi:hypothetical protein
MPDLPWPDNELFWVVDALMPSLLPDDENVPTLLIDRKAAPAPNVERPDTPVPVEEEPLTPVPRGELPRTPVSNDPDALASLPITPAVPLLEDVLLRLV